MNFCEVQSENKFILEKVYPLDNNGSGDDAV
jgi:hypothetical protein